MRSVLFISLASLLIVGCEQKNTDTAQQAAANAASEPTVMTTFYPLEYVTKRIAGDTVKVVNPCPPDADPAFWEPDTDTLVRYQQADLIIINGANFEKWVGKATLPEEKLVDTTAKLREPLLKLERGVTHSHGTGAHTHVGIDGHTWIDPLTLAQQANEIHTALVAKYPEDKATFFVNIQALQKDLKQLGQRFADLSVELKKIPLVCNHPAYNYLARRYQWQLKTFYFEPDSAELEEAEAKRLEDYLKQQPTKWILWEAQPDEAVEKLFKERFGLTSVVFSPCETLDEEQRAAGEDFLKVMYTNANRLEEILIASGNG